MSLLTWSLFTWIPDWQQLISGAAVSAFVARLTGDLFISRPHIIKHPVRYWYFIAYYLPMLIWECFKANIDVAGRVLHPKLLINPGIVKVTTNLRSDTGLTFLANSITLTPGTMVVDIDKDNKTLYIHWINVTAKDTAGATRIIAERFEKILEKIFE